MDVDQLWLRTLEEVINRAAHEVKDALNGVSLNVEVIRSRSSRPDALGAALSPFATAASDQLESLTTRTEAVLFLARPPREPADVAVALKHLAALLVPAAKADGQRLTVDSNGSSAPTAASAQATRLVLAAALLALIKEGGGSCRIESEPSTLVRFSHESARNFDVDPAVAKAAAQHNIQLQRSGSDLLLQFPRNS